MGGGGGGGGVGGWTLPEVRLRKSLLHNGYVLFPLFQSFYQQTTPFTNV